jgi:hypothetical protein
MAISAKWIVLSIALLGCTLPLGSEEPVHSTVMEVLHGKPYVMVMVNGMGPFRFIVDTGTGGQAVITPEFAEQLELEEEGEALLNDPTGQGSQKVPFVAIDSLSFAGVEFGDVKAVVHRLSNTDGPCVGMLGFPLFRDYLLTLDYPNLRLRMDKGQLEQDGGQTVVPFRMPEGVPVTTLEVGNLRVDAQIDSGGAGLSLPEQIASRLKFSETPRLFAKGQSLSTRFEIKVGKLVPDIRLGDFTLNQPWVEINAAFPLANFGAVPLQYFTVTFDQRNQLLRLAGPHKHIKLGITPVPMNLMNQPSVQSADAKLVPVG